MVLNTKNLENCGWLFSPSMGIMVREHELLGGKWDIEIEFYRKVGKSMNPPNIPGLWEADTNVIYDAFKTVADVLVGNPEFKNVRDWVHGDNVEFV